MNRSQIVIDDIVLNYYRNNGNSDFVVLFLHGRARSGIDWEIYFEKLESKGISFISIDFPGFGFSTMPKNIRGVKEYSQLVFDFLKKIGNNKKIICVGHSFGGRIAFYLAANYPDLFTKLVLIAPGGVENLANGFRKGMVNIIKTIFGLPGLRFFGNYIKNKIGSSDYRSAGKMRDTFVRIVNEDLRDVLGKIRIPTIIYRGDKDDQILERQIDIMEKSIPNVKVNKYKTIGHDLHIEKFEDILVELNN